MIKDEYISEFERFLEGLDILLSELKAKLKQLKDYEIYDKMVNSGEITYNETL